MKLQYIYIGIEPCRSGEAAFGMQNGRIQNSQITASTLHSPGLSPQQGRLNSASSWSAGRNDQNQWIQVDLGREEVVTAIGTQGRANYGQWVKTYSVSYGSNGNASEPYNIDDAVKVRKNNYNSWTLYTRRKYSGVKYFIISRPRKQRILPAAAGFRSSDLRITRRRSTNWDTRSGTIYPECHKHTRLYQSIYKCPMFMTFSACIICFGLIFESPGPEFLFSTL